MEELPGAIRAASPCATCCLEVENKKKIKASPVKTQASVLAKWQYLHSVLSNKVSNNSLQKDGGEKHNKESLFLRAFVCLNKESKGQLMEGGT